MLTWLDIKGSDTKPTDILHRLGLHTPPIDPIQIAGQLGITVLCSPSVFESFVIDSSGNPVITVDSTCRDSKKRFDCAVALGKMVSTSRLNIIHMFWAVELTMPEYWVRAYRYVTPESFLYQVFNVSQEAMDLRLKLL